MKKLEKMVTEINRHHAGTRALRPQILITPDGSLAGANGEPVEAEYRVRSNYAHAIAEAGGLPLIVPHRLDCLEEALILTDGVLITGTLPGVQATPERGAFEQELIRSALKRAIPILGICHGMQLLGQCLGGRLLEEIPESDGVRIDHNPRPVPDQVAHSITLVPNTILNTGALEIDVEVNSLHGHTLIGPGQFCILARASDGIIEAITGDTPAFCLGVQWHPEYQLTQLDRDLLVQFISASEAFAQSRIPLHNRLRKEHK
jgi:gamma-glutamyl-gamma-aminobutyrate hydrolase PuuD